MWCKENNLAFWFPDLALGVESHSSPYRRHVYRQLGYPKRFECVFLQVTLHTGLPIPDFYTPGEADPTGSVC